MKNLIIFGLIIAAIVAGFVYTLNKNQKGGNWITSLKNSRPAALNQLFENNIENNMTEETNTPDEKIITEKLKTPPPQEPLIKIDKKYTAVLKTTAGEIKISLNAATTPSTVNNFVYLSKKDFYDNTIFHRIIKGFMIQGGDPKGDGTGGPAYRFQDEKFEGEYTRGIVAMANAGLNTNGSQFFIMHADYPLPPNYVIFGKVVSGMDVVDKIAEAPTKPTGENSTPVDPVVVEDVEIVEE